MLAIMLALQLSAVGSHRIPVAEAETLQVEASGSLQGMPVVLLPGFAGSAYAFRHVARGLGEGGALVIIIEPLAVGRSSRPKKADYSLTAQALRVAAALDSLGVTGAVVVGQGVNATTALRLSVARPELVRRLVLIEGGAAERAASSAMRRLADMPGLHLLGMGRIRGWFRKGMIESSGDPVWVTDEVVDGYLTGLRVDFRGSIEAFKAVARSEEPDHISDRLAEVQAPAMLLLGGARHKSGPSDREVNMLRASVRSLETTVVPGAGHHLAEEAATAVVAATLAAVRGTGVAMNPGGTP